jgi:NADPH:quinone reductase-like Zn-dependent oxidoreductase
MEAPTACWLAKCQTRNFSAINEEDVAIKPKTLSMEEAASIPLVGLTAWQALIERAV